MELRDESGRPGQAGALLVGHVRAGLRGVRRGLCVRAHHDGGTLRLPARAPSPLVRTRHTFIQSECHRRRVRKDYTWAHIVHI